MLDPVPKWLWIIPLMLFAMMATASAASKAKAKENTAAMHQLEDCPDPGYLACAPLAAEFSGDTVADHATVMVADLVFGRHDAIVSHYEMPKTLKPITNPYTVSALRPHRYAVLAYSRGKNLRIRDWVISAPTGREKLNYTATMIRASAAYNS